MYRVPYKITVARKDLKPTTVFELWLEDELYESVSGRALLFRYHTDNIDIPFICITNDTGSVRLVLKNWKIRCTQPIPYVVSYINSPTLNFAAMMSLTDEKCMDALDKLI